MLNQCISCSPALQRLNIDQDISIIAAPEETLRSLRETIDENEQRPISIIETSNQKSKIVSQSMSPVQNVWPEIEGSYLLSLSPGNPRRSSIEITSSLPILGDDRTLQRKSVVEGKQAAALSSSSVLSISGMESVHDTFIEAAKSTPPSFTSKHMNGEDPKFMAAKLATVRRRSIVENPTFHSGTSSSSSDTGIIIESVQQARRKRPKIVTYGSGERTKAEKVLGIDLASIVREQGGVPTSVLRRHYNQNPKNTITSNSRDMLQETPVSPRPFFNTPLKSGLTANPPDLSLLPKRAATMPIRRVKKASFVPTPLDTEKSHRAPRQSIVSTPYPFPDGESTFVKRNSRARAGNPPQLAAHLTTHAETELEFQEATPAALTLVLYCRQNSSPITGTIFIARKINSSAKLSHPSFPASPTPSVDDECLIRLVRSEYIHLRSWWKVLFSARHITSIRIVSFRRLSDLDRLSNKSLHHHSIVTLESDLRGNTGADTLANHF